jgi:hypothetical protein
MTQPGEQASCKFCFTVKCSLHSNERIMRWRNEITTKCLESECSVVLALLFSWPMTVALAKMNWDSRIPWRRSENSMISVFCTGALGGQIKKNIKTLWEKALWVKTGKKILSLGMNRNLVCLCDHFSQCLSLIEILNIQNQFCKYQQAVSSIITT